MKESPEHGKGRSRREWVKRCVMMLAGIFVLSMGIAATKCSGLGVSQVSSVANVLGIRFPALSLGTWIIFWNLSLVLIQILVLRRDFRGIDFLQIPISFLFGWWTDLGVTILSPIPIPGYPVRLLFSLAGIAVLSFGVLMTLAADVAMNVPDAFVRMLAEKAHRSFGIMKVIFDIICVALAVVLSLILFGGKIVGVREGTILAAVLTGFVVKLYTRWWKEPLLKLLA